MKRVFICLSLLLIGANVSHAQDDVFDSKIPKSKQAMLVVDVSPEKIFGNKIFGPLVDRDSLSIYGPPIEMEDYENISRITVFVGNPELRTGESEFVARIRVKDKTKLADLTEKMFGFGREGLDTHKEDGWTVADIDRGWPGMVRYKDDLLEFGTELYAYTPSKSLASDSLAQAFGTLDKEAAVRIAFDAQVLAKFFDSFMSMESVEEEAVYNMIKWGEFINEYSMVLYGANIVKDLKTASLSVDLEADQIATLNIQPVSGKEDSVKAKAKVLHDFVMFHVNLPVKTLKKKKNPVAGILEKVANGIKLSDTESGIQLSVSKPKDISKDFLAIVEKMRVSFADRENSNKFKQIVLATHNYHDTHKQFPMAPPRFEGDRFSKELSWRVRILPFCEYYNEYDKMDTTKGWDAKANQPVIAKCKDAFILSNGAMICGIKTEPPAARFANILDGTSNTIMVIENRKAAMTPWTKPFDLTIDQAVKLVTALEKGDFLWVGMYDGSVWKMPSIKGTDVTEDELKALFNPRDGMAISPDDILQDASPRMFDIEPPRRGRFRDTKKAVDKADFDDIKGAIEDDVPAPAIDRGEFKKGEFKKEAAFEKSDSDIVEKIDDYFEKSKDK